MLIIHFGLSMGKGWDWWDYSATLFFIAFLQCSDTDKKKVLGSCYKQRSELTRFKSFNFFS